MKKVLITLVLGVAFSGVNAATLLTSYSLSAINGFTCVAEGEGSGSLTSSGCSDVVRSGSFALSGSGAASYDTLRASAGASFSGVEPSGFVGFNSRVALAAARALSSDRLTIDISGRTGETVDLFFTTELNGSSTAGSDSSMFTQADGSLAVRVNGKLVVITQGAKSEGDLLPVDRNPGLVQIVLGTSFAVSSELNVRAMLFTRTPIDSKYSGDALANFGNSAGITSFELFETGSDELITDWALTSESGEFGFYSPVPVPASLWLFGSGLLGLIGISRRKKTA